MLDGQVYKFPMMVSEFMEYGWTCKEEDEEIKASSYSSYRFKRGNDAVYVYVANMGINKLPAKECVAGGIQVQKGQYDYSGEIIIPGGFAIGTAGVDEVRAVYGTPSDTYDGQYSIRDTYEEDYQSTVRVTFDKENGNILDEIDIKNLVEPEGFDPGTVDTSRIPEVTAMYTAPSGLSDNLLDYTVEFGGDLYVLPAPVSAFIDNGWKIKEKDSRLVMEGSGYGKVTLTRDNQDFYDFVINYDENATTAENYFVVSLEAGNYANKLSFKVAHGLEIGADESVIANLTGYTIEKEESQYANHYYISDDRSRTYGYDVRCEDGKITGFTVEYSPKRSEYRESLGLE